MKNVAYQYFISLTITFSSQVKAEQKRANKDMIETENTYKASVRKVRDVSEQIKKKVSNVEIQKYA